MKNVFVRIATVIVVSPLLYHNGSLNYAMCIIVLPDLEAYLQRRLTVPPAALVQLNSSIL